MGSPDPGKGIRDAGTLCAGSQCRFPWHCPRGYSPNQHSPAKPKLHLTPQRGSHQRSEGSDDQPYHKVLVCSES